MPSSNLIGLKNRWPQVILWILLLGLTSCGYHFPGGGSLPAGIHSLAIPTFTNLSQETGIESTVTRALVDRFVSARTLQITGEDSADAVLTGSVRSFVVTPIAVTSGTQTTTEYRGTIALEIILKHRDGRILAKQEVSEWRNFPVDPNNPAATTSNRQDAIQQTSILLAQKIYEVILENF